MQTAIAVAAGFIGFALSILSVVNLVDTIVGTKKENKFELLKLQSEARMELIQRSLNELKDLSQALHAKQAS
jgi:hypothetical protein